MEAPPIRVGVLTPDPLLGEGLAALLNQSREFICAGNWTESASMLRELGVDPTDVLLIDAHLSDSSCFDVLNTVLKTCDKTRVIVMVDCQEAHCVVLNPRLSVNSDSPKRFRSLSREYPEPDDCLQIALKNGAHGVLRRQCPFSRIAEAIRAVHAGQCWMELPTAARLARQYLLSLHPTPPMSISAGSKSLTLRERQIVSLIAQGRSNKEIAGELRLGYSTVKNYVSSILQKLHLSDRTQLALYVVAHSPADT
ncbi:MAG TPA: response regulator transcription factor [Nitrososphaera sp.]|nr:response regulator transcription factor [Nitrososphaera sp.]